MYVSLELFLKFDSIDKSSLITSSQCPVMHFAQALPSADGVSVDLFGAGSDVNGSYESSMTLCQYNTETNTWKRILNSGNVPPARRNAAFEFTSSNLTFVFGIFIICRDSLLMTSIGGSSEPMTGLTASSAYYPNFWHQDTFMYNSATGVWINGPTYNGPPRANATITQISDTNGQLVIVGGALIDNTSAVDMVTNYPLANMSDIIVLDPRTSIWTNIKTNGSDIPIARKHHTTTLHPDGHTLVVIGGEYFNDAGAYLLNDVWTLDTRNMNNFTWTKPTVQGQGLYRSNHTSLLIGDQIWVIAGTNASSKAVDIQLLNVTDWTWSYSAVSRYVPPEPFASVGSVKGLIGIVIGSFVGACLLVAGLTFWWCRRHRIKPCSKKNAPPKIPNHYESTSQDIMTTGNSKAYLPRTSLSTTVSNAEWNAHSTMQQAKGHYMPQFNTAAVPIGSSTLPATEGYQNENYYSLYNSNPGIDHSDIEHHPRQSMGYWESSPPFLSHQQTHLMESPHSNYFLMPLGAEKTPLKPMFGPQRLQKPNELDQLIDETVCSSSTLDEDPSHAVKSTDSVVANEEKNK
ncbi:uncharacterized protein B0P05DRAFT_574791 [Gilbertella persicaria]|uniref:Acyl-CoA-binding domain-containing protein 4 n=1 Tax=Rhizopus stolonifer TaxID=4846 RepID=A0A367KSJ7_RHIST|nr:uncharacterized protein B0P05DRAFT_574791 [Gilbertella persicaria]KAI8059915.1 hypothetical protein B0P05DRAFT_574791 [Gilbertella persicaria]RCI05178.1 acyl-CoA-binding domain-containing protein 4 [Rhizopus stolonifer]